jgi:hypothetical protein
MTTGRGDSNPTWQQASTGDPDEVVALWSFGSPLEAELCRAKLEDEDIECFLSGGHMTHTTIGYLHNTVTLNVRRRDAGRAEAILNRRQSVDLTPEELLATIEPEAGVELIEDELIKPDVKRDVSGHGAGIAFLLSIGVLFLAIPGWPDSTTPLTLLWVASAGFWMGSWRYRDRLDERFKVMANLTLIFLAIGAMRLAWTALP